MALLIQCGQPVIARDNSAYGDSYWSGVAFISKRLSELGIHPYQLAGPRPAGRLPAPGPQTRSSSTAWPCPSACPTPARPCGPPATSAGSGLDAPGSGRACPRASVPPAAIAQPVVLQRTKVGPVSGLALPGTRPEMVAARRGPPGWSPCIQQKRWRAV